MANRILFAVETVKTSQGFFDPGQLLPKEDLPEDEIRTLLESGQAGHCAYNSPMAAYVHDARKMLSNKGQATELLKGALKTVSGEAPEEPEAVEESKLPEGPTGVVGPDGSTSTEKTFPSVDEFVKAGYKAENYEAMKAEYLKDTAVGSVPGVPEGAAPESNEQS